MKKTCITLSGIFALSMGLFTAPLSAATRGDVKILEATDEIRSVSDNMAREYLLFALFPHKRFAKEDLDDELSELPEAFKEIAEATNDKRTKGLLTFFTYQKARADEILESDKPPRELANEMLDMSRSFNEGAAAIARNHTYKFTPQEAMFMLTRAMKRDIASLAKLYVAREIFPDDPSLVSEIAVARKDFESGLKKIDAYKYPDPESREARTKLKAIWAMTRDRWSRPDPKKHLPIVLSIAANEIANLLEVLGEYHSKNQ